MQTSSYLIHGLLVLAQLVAGSSKCLDIIPCGGDDEGNSVINRSCFGEDFMFGTGSSAYQFEGAANEGGRGASIWDSFTHTYRDKIEDGSDGDVAVDSYHRYKEDVLILKEMGVDAYRFSISWSRVLPSGKQSDAVNMEGIKYYNNLMDELLANGITPFVTLLHFDIPQALQNQYGGFLNRQIVHDFRDYAELCFKEFGDRVKHWITINEPWTLSVMGYANCDIAPCRCSSWEKEGNKPKCTGGDSSTEPYIVAHHQILAHAAAVQVYRQKYQACQGGKIGMTLHIMWFLPFSNEEKDVEATERALDFMAGWFLEPMTFGDYPSSMRSLLYKRGIPNFSEEETTLLKGSFDFLGINYYTSRYVQNNVSKIHEGYYNDMKADLLVKGVNGTPIGDKERSLDFAVALYFGASSWLYVYPKGIEDLLVYIKKNYGDPIIYITENGYDEYDDGTTSIWDALADKKRVNYLRKHLFFLLRAMKAGVKVKGYFAWSFLDNFEWCHGYRLRFGLNYVDYKNGLRRYPKVSATWFKIFLENSSRSSKSQILDE